MIPICITIYKKSNRKSTTNLIRAIVLLLESIISCNIAEDCEKDSDQ